MKIRVSRPHMPDKTTLKKYIDKIYDTKWLTNSGPLEIELRHKLADYFGVRKVALTCNATIGLEVSLSALAQPNDRNVYTTPYSFKATSSSIERNHLLPIYCDTVSQCDVRMNTAHIVGTDNLILDTHVYGIPSKLTGSQLENSNRTIYDAAHCFDVFIGNEHITKHGAASVVSMHATKLFNSIEGGVIVSKDEAYIEDIRDRSNFALKNINSRSSGNYKLSEFHAAFGLANFMELDIIIEARAELKYTYDNIFKKSNSKCCPIDVPSLSYYPLLFSDRLLADNFQSLCAGYGIEVRKYFDCALNRVYSSKECPNAESLVGRIICLPMSSQFTSNERQFISSSMMKVVFNDLH